MRPTLHQQAFWLYGVIVALAIREALTSIVPLFLPPPGGELWPLRLEALRLATFLLVTARLFLGSVTYYESTYFSEGVADEKKTYPRDYLSGFFHFLFVFAWSLTLDPAKVPQGYHIALLSLVLLYDLIWLFICRHETGIRQVRLWTVINVLTVLLGAVIMLVAGAVGLDSTTGELGALSVVVIVSLIDLAEMVGGEPIFARWVEKLIPAEQ